MSQGEHYSSSSGIEDISAQLTSLRGRFDEIMAALETTAINTFGVWEGAGQENAKADDEEFNQYFDEVQTAFDSLIGANNDVASQMSSMHAGLDKLFQR